MFRKLLMLGAVVGSAAAVPALYQNNPDVYRSWLRETLAEKPDEAKSAPPRHVAVKRLEMNGETSVLLGKKVSIAADGRGHYMGRFKLNGREIRAMVDTGATYIALNKSTAHRIGVRLSASDFKYKVNTANGQAKAATATVGTLQIGRIFVENVDAVVLEDQALDGVLIGMSFLKRLARYQVENGELILEQ